jgi:hypothetical protein
MRALVLALSAVPLGAQMDHMDHSQHGMSGMQMGPMNQASMLLMNLASGTSQNPASWPMPMLMTHIGGWEGMFMGTAFLVDTQQSGPRGGDKLYSASWFMARAEHVVGAGAFNAELMLSLDPATITRRRYPLLFQTGETAYGVPLADAQHPHNFVMELGFRYARQLGQGTVLETYFAPVGDPALGPVAYPHRASAAELPQAPISHHLQDSTHIADEVVTVGLSHRQFRLEASGFHGAEPGENRWTIQTGAIDSWSARLWFLPARNWAIQISGGRLAHPEQLEPGDQVRTTASLAYTRPIAAGGAWSSTLSWGRTHNTATRRDNDSWLAETVLPLRRLNFLTGRVEVVDKDELFAAQPEIEQRLQAAYGGSFRVAAYTFGYTRDIELFRYLETGIGANVTFYGVPEAIQPYYGRHPVGGNFFLRFRLRQPDT